MSEPAGPVAPPGTTAASGTAPSEPARAVRDDWHSVAPRYLWVDLANRTLGWIVPCAILVVLGVTVVGWWWWAAAGVASVVAVSFGATTPARVRAIRYRLRADDLEFRHGIMWRRIVAVPYGRMQLIDIARGPVARALGLAELRFVTAAATTRVTIPGLREGAAEELRDELVALAESRRAGL